MEPTFRKSMAWLHTWAGVVIGSLLFAIFWMGSLSVFDREIDRWMMPLTRLGASADGVPIRLDGALTDNALALTRGSAQWFMRLPSDRMPAVELRWRTRDGSTERRYLDPASGQVLEHTGTLGGTGFIFPFHYSLHLKWKDLGYWLVGLAGMAMLVMLVSGVIIHRRIFADFFLFRPKKQLQRASLDLHNLSGVLALPLHFAIALSGLIIFFSIYWPSSYHAAYPEAREPRQAFSAQGLGQYRRARAHAPGTLGSLDAMVAAAEQSWQGGKANFVRVWHPGDANSHVEIRRSHADAVTMNLDQVYFDAASGAVLHRFEAQPVMTVQRFISGLHFIQFEHWALRWLYFLAGLSGCVMIATGHLFWLESRRASHENKGLAGVRVVEVLAVGSVTGIIMATLAFFVANRLLPLNARQAGLDRAELEMSVFYLVWLGSFAHAALRQRAAWREQAWAVAALALLAVALNWLTTGHHLPHALRHGLWAVAGMDALLLLGAALAAWSARRLGRRAREQRVPASQGAQPAQAAHHA
ncbi:MAG: PepSY-associated TM helix domain-containing protein [Burkholderiaceae bacterium]